MVTIVFSNAFCGFRLTRNLLMQHDMIHLSLPEQLAGLRDAFVPQTLYWQVNTAADTWADWLDFLEREPKANLRKYAQMLIHHEVRRWQTPAMPLICRVVRFLRSQLDDSPLKTGTHRQGRGSHEITSSDGYGGPLALQPACT